MPEYARNTRGLGEQVLVDNLMQRGFEVKRDGAHFLADRDGERVAFSLISRSFREGSQESEMTVIPRSRLEKVESFAEDSNRQPCIAFMVQLIDRSEIHLFMAAVFHIREHFTSAQHGYSLYYSEQRIEEHISDTEVYHVKESIPYVRKHSTLAGEGEQALPQSAIELERVLQRVRKRLGQTDFRQRLIVAYNARCAITECDAVEALEAAHIDPYCGVESNEASNGLLLRADVHTLFDLGLIGIKPGTFNVVLSRKLAVTSYACLDGKPLVRPETSSDCPDAHAIANRWRKFTDGERTT